jgi:hypothetical protein
MGVQNANAHGEQGVQYPGSMPSSSMPCQTAQQQSMSARNGDARGEPSMQYQSLMPFQTMQQHAMSPQKGESHGDQSMQHANFLLQTAQQPSGGVQSTEAATYVSSPSYDQIAGAGAGAAQERVVATPSGNFQPNGYFATAHQAQDSYKFASMPESDTESGSGDESGRPDMPSRISSIRIDTPEYLGEPLNPQMYSKYSFKNMSGANTQAQTQAAYGNSAQGASQANNWCEPGIPEGDESRFRVSFNDEDKDWRSSFGRDSETLETHTPPTFHSFHHESFMDDQDGKDKPAKSLSFNRPSWADEDPLSDCDITPLFNQWTSEQETLSPRQLELRDQPRQNASASLEKTDI